MTSGDGEREPSDAVRQHLVRALAWEEGHVGFEKAVAGVGSDSRGVLPPGFDHSIWDLVEHIRIAQEDILDFCVNDRYTHDRKWPDDYWPPQPAPASDEAWSDSLAAYARDLERLRQLARAAKDLTGTVPTGKGDQTFLRALLLIVDHTAYHVGQIVALRRALGIW
jgi:uncharacterized damage-inducible protein DinB